jgi:ADP-ribosylglycohydrolase
MNTNGFYGAIIGDMVGSAFELGEACHPGFSLFSKASHFTDDTILTLATMDLIELNAFCGPICNHYQAIARGYQDWANRFPNAGYGERFLAWMSDPLAKSYGSKGNGAAMRVSPIAYVADSKEECLWLAKESAHVTHNSKEGTKGALAIALLTYMASKGKNKEAIKETAIAYYPNIAWGYYSLISYAIPSALAEDTVPEAIAAFLESTSFEDCLRKAVLVGGDTDTLASMAGSIAGPFYGIDERLVDEALERIDDEESLKVLDKFASLVKKH